MPIKDGFNDEDWSPSYDIDSGHLLRCAAIITSKG